jgi:large conductance mechanosensitive channel
MSMMKEFKLFAMRGNVVDLAVAVIIGGAFGKIVASLVADVVMPIVGLLLGGVNFTSLSITVGDAVIKYGAFIQAIVDFVIIAWVIFLALKALSKMKKVEPPPPPPPPPPQEVLLTEIRDLLKKGR